MAEAGANAAASRTFFASSAAQRSGQHVAIDGVGEVKESFMKVCAMLQISEQAPHGWVKIHVKPHVGCVMYFASVSAAIITIAVLFLWQVAWDILIVKVPALIAVLSLSFCAAWMWRFGPTGDSAPVYLTVFAIFGFATSLTVMATMTGPARYAPFGDRLKFIIVNTVAVFASMLSGLNGGAAADHPPQPYTSIWPSMWKASLTTMRIVDVLTDIGFLRILLDQGPDCMWYGKAVPCMHYMRMAIAAGVMAATNMLLMIALLLTTGQDSLFQSAGRRFKLVLAANTAIMLCEVGGVTVALLKVFSDLQLEAAGDSRRLRREAAFALASCVSTLFSFGINVFGMRNVLVVLRMWSLGGHEVAHTQGCPHLFLIWCWWLRKTAFLLQHAAGSRNRGPHLSVGSVKSSFVRNLSCTLTRDVYRASL